MNHENLTVALLVRWLVSLLFCGFLSVFVLFAFYNRIGAVITQLCCMGMYYALMIQAAYQSGCKDHNKVLFGKAVHRPAKGFLSGLIMSVPSMAVSAVFVIFRLTGVYQSAFLLAYRLINAPYYALNLMLLPTALSMNEISVINVVLSACLCLIAPVLIGLAYWTGSRGEELPFAALIPHRSAK